MSRNEPTQEEKDISNKIAHDIVAYLIAAKEKYDGIDHGTAAVALGAGIGLAAFVCGTTHKGGPAAYADLFKEIITQ